MNEHQKFKYNTLQLCIFSVGTLNLSIHVWKKRKCKNTKIQESPPAWTQEAYHPPCSEYSFCCPIRVPPRGGTWPGYPRGEVPDRGTPRGGPDLGTPQGGYLTWVPPRGVRDPGYLTWVPPGGTWPGYPQGGNWPGYPRGRGVPDPGTPPRGGTWPGYPQGGYLTRVPPGEGVPDPGTPLPGGTWPRYPPGGYLTWVPPGGYLTWVPPPGVPDLGTPSRGGVPDPGTPSPPGGVQVPPHCLMAFWEMLQRIMGHGYPPCGQTDWWMDRRVSKHYLPSYYVRGR